MPRGDCLAATRAEDLGALFDVDLIEGGTVFDDFRVGGRGEASTGGRVLEGGAGEWVKDELVGVLEDTVKAGMGEVLCNSVSIVAGTG